jgi:hypothetical protein
MGRRSAPKGRLSLRFSRVELGMLVILLAIVVAGLLGGFSVGSAAEQLLREGRCVPARASGPGWLHSHRGGNSADLQYELDGQRHTGTLYFPSDRVSVGTIVTICVRDGEPATFAVRLDQSYGTSVNLWLRETLGLLLAAMAFVGLMVLLSQHEWRV